MTNRHQFVEENVPSKIIDDQKSNMNLKDIQNADENFNKII